MKLTKAEASILSRLFSPGVFRELEKSSRSATLGRLIEASPLMMGIAEDENLGDSLDRAFRALRLSDMRDDYVFRTAVVQRILLGRHSLNTASVLNEFRGARSKADLVILNGTSTAYELKSDRDSLARLPHQLEDFRRHFAKVAVVASENHLSRLEQLAPSDVGIFTLTRNFSLRTIREPLHRPELIDPGSLIDSLRIDEAKCVLEGLGEEIPEVSNTAIRAELRGIAARKDPFEVHEIVVRVLRETRSQAGLRDFIARLPGSLGSVALSRNPNTQGQQHVMSALSASLGEALSWR